MDVTTASYYRAVLFADGQDAKPLPQSLVELHAWSAKRHQALGLGPIVSKAVALTIALTWMGSTEDGREFTRTSTTLGDMFREPGGEATAGADSGKVDWDKVPKQTHVVVTCGDGTVKEGVFGGRRGAWLDVLIDGEMKPHRANKVQLAGE